MDKWNAKTTENFITINLEVRLNKVSFNIIQLLLLQKFQKTNINVMILI